MEKRDIQIVCKSVFKSGEKISKNQYTQKWIETINQLEKSKKNAIPKA